MIKVESLFYGIDQRLNKLSSNYHQMIPEEDKTLAINHSQIKLIKQKLSGKNSYQLGLDSFKKRYQDLEKFIENPEDHSLDLVLTDSSLNKYSVDVSELTPKLMFYIDSYLIASKGRCKDRIIYVNNELVKHNDVTSLLNDSNFKPSFEYQETFCQSSSNQLSYYSDGTFALSNAYLSYLRYPAYVRLGDFELPDGTVLEGKQDCELEEYLEDELLDLIVKDLASYIENQAAVENSRERIAEDE